MFEYFKYWAVGAKIFVGLIALVIFPDLARTQQRYGAIALDETSGGSGWSYNYSSQAAADQTAIRQCGASSCRVVRQFWGSYCGAVARSTDGAWGSTGGATEAQARQESLSLCEKSGGKSCKIIASACNDGAARIERALQWAQRCSKRLDDRCKRDISEIVAFFNTCDNDMRFSDVVEAILRNTQSHQLDAEAAIWDFVNDHCK